MNVSSVSGNSNLWQLYNQQQSSPTVSTSSGASADSPSGTSTTSGNTAATLIDGMNAINSGTMNSLASNLNQPYLNQLFNQLA